MGYKGQLTAAEDYADKRLMNEEFHELHFAYGSEFRWRWIKLNEILIAAADECGVDYSTTETRWFLSRLAKNILVNLHSFSEE